MMAFCVPIFRNIGDLPDKMDCFSTTKWNREIPESGACMNTGFGESSGREKMHDINGNRGVLVTSKIG
jgi:hypothetical protein